MCGIAGAAWTTPEKLIDSDLLDRMTDVLQHRGPDGRGTYQQQYENGLGVGLGHRRLAIIDLDGGKQPICNEDGTVWITFNGEIYNYRELRRDLIGRGHQFRTESDTETIVHLYEELGPKCLDQLQGMFAFAIWDERKRSLLLARDRLGQKPLVYRNVDGQLLFSSEIKSILQVPGIQRSVDPDALNQFLALGYVPHPRTMFCGIHKLPPAHYAVFKNGNLSLTRYWEPEWEFETSRSLDDLCDELRLTLLDSVKLRLRSDVPVGAFLSGGIDSTAVVSIMQELADQPTKTFTMGFPVKKYDETEFAQCAADHLGTKHRELNVDPGSVDLLPRLTWHFDEPFGDSSAMPTFELAAGTRKHVKVALTGDGGDELFAGYPRYQTVQELTKFDRLPKPLARLIANPIWQLLPGSVGDGSFWSRLRFRMNILRQPPTERYLNWVSYFEGSQKNDLLASGLRSQISESAESRLMKAFSGSGRAMGSRAMMCDLQTYLPGDLLTKVDATSMAHGLECRSPFMDHRVVELAMAIPFHHHANGKYPKPVLTRTFEDLIPKPILERSKRGFCVPLDHWFRGPLKTFSESRLLESRALGRDYFRPEFVQKLMNEHQSGKWNHGERIWILLCFEQWHRDYIDQSSPPSAAPETVSTQKDETIKAELQSV